MLELQTVDKTVIKNNWLAILGTRLAGTGALNEPPADPGAQAGFSPRPFPVQ